MPPAVREALAATVAHVQNAILLADDAQRYVYANPAASRIFGYSNEEFLRMSLWDLTPVPDRNTARQLWARFVRDGSQTGEFRIACKDGSVRVFQYSAVANITPGLHMSDLHDITDLVHAREVERERVEHKKLLIQEMHHRVRNTLVGVLTLVRLQLGDVEDPHVRAMMSRIAARIDAMSEANRLLRNAGTETNTTSLRALLTAITRSAVTAMALEPDLVRWSVESPDIEIGWEEATPLSLIIHEVLTNFLKYSLPRGESVEIRVTCEGNERADSGLRIDFSRPFSTAPNTWQPGFGLRLLDALIGQLGSRPAWEFGEHSAAFALQPEAP